MVGRGFVHAGGIEVADFTGDGIPPGRGLRSFLEDIAQKVEIVLIELAVDRP